MKKFLLCSVLLPFATQATETAPHRQYISASIGEQFINADFNNRSYSANNIGYGIVLGQNAGKYFRYEGEVSRISSSFDEPNAMLFEYTGFDISAISMTANGYFYYPLSSYISPYAGAGLGIANMSAKTYSKMMSGGSYFIQSSAIDKIGFSYQLIGGFLFNMSERFGLDLKVKYQDFGKIDAMLMTKKMGEISTSAFSISLGANYKFSW